MKNKKQKAWYRLLIVLYLGCAAMVAGWYFDINTGLKYTSFTYSMIITAMLIASFFYEDYKRL